MNPIPQNYGIDPEITFGEHVVEFTSETSKELELLRRTDNPKMELSNDSGRQPAQWPELF